MTEKAKAPATGTRKGFQVNQSNGLEGFEMNDTAGTNLGQARPLYPGVSCVTTQGSGSSNVNYFDVPDNSDYAEGNFQGVLAFFEVLKNCREEEDFSLMTMVIQGVCKEKGAEGGNRSAAIGFLYALEELLFDAVNKREVDSALKKQIRSHERYLEERLLRHRTRHAKLMEVAI